MEPEKAMEDLHEIRKIMADTLSVMVLSGWQGIAWGVLFFIGGLVTHIYGLSGAVKVLWIVIVVAGSIAETFFYVRKAIRKNLPSHKYRRLYTVYLARLALTYRLQTDCSRRTVTFFAKLHILPCS